MARGAYLPIYPVYVGAEARSRHEFAIAVGEHLRGLDLGSIGDFQREYRTRMTKIRLHQPFFRHESYMPISRPAIFVSSIT